jgi:hypothetical protein
LAPFLPTTQLRPNNRGTVARANRRPLQSTRAVRTQSRSLPRMETRAKLLVSRGTPPSRQLEAFGPSPMERVRHSQPRHNHPRWQAIIPIHARHVPTKISRLTSDEPTRSHRCRNPEGLHRVTSWGLLALFPHHGRDDVPTSRAPALASTLPTESHMTRHVRTQRRRQRAPARCFHRSSTRDTSALRTAHRPSHALRHGVHRTSGLSPLVRRVAGEAETIANDLPHAHIASASNLTVSRATGSGQTSVLPPKRPMSHRLGRNRPSLRTAAKRH